MSLKFRFALPSLIIIFSLNAFSDLQKGAYDCDNDRNLNVGYNKATGNYNVWFSYKGGFAGSYSAVPLIFKLNQSSNLAQFYMEKTGLPVGKIRVSKYENYSQQNDVIELKFEENIEAVVKASFNNPVNPQPLVSCIYNAGKNEFVY